MAGTPLAKALQQRGHRLTRSRLAVLQVLDEAGAHLKVAELHRRAQRLSAGISLASVYRTMDLLAQLGLVTRVHTDHRQRHYAPVSHGHGHHLICNGCGRVVEFTDCRMGALARRLSRRARFQIESHSLEFFGRCEDCRSLAPAARGRRP
ncbi:MAG: Fur family transcriptional regulator [Candidatus Methylomirabilales bacterium]